MEFTVSGTELKNVFKVGRAFSRVGETAGSNERSIVFRQNQVTAAVDVQSKRDLGAFWFLLHSEPTAPADRHVYAVNAEIADKVARLLTDANCTMHLQSSGGVSAATGWVRQSGRQYDLALTVLIERQVGTAMISLVDAGTVVGDKRELMVSLTEMASMMLRASDRPHNFFYLDTLRDEVCACDSHQLMIHKLGLVGPRADGALVRARIHAGAIWLMKVIAAFGDDLKVNLVNDRTIQIECGGAYGVFTSQEAVVEIPDWRLMQLGGLEFMINGQRLEKLVDMALSDGARWLRFTLEEEGVWALAGMMEGKNFQPQTKKMRVADPIEGRGSFGLPIYYMLCASKYFAGMNAVTVRFANDLGPILFRSNEGGVDRKQYLMPAAMTVFDDRAVSEMKEFALIGSESIAVQRETGNAVSAKSLISGDVIEKGAERFLVWWVALDLDMIKLELLDGRWRRTGKLRTNRLSSYDKTAVYQLPQKKVKDGNV